MERAQLLDSHSLPVIEELFLELAARGGDPIVLPNEGLVDLAKDDKTGVITLSEEPVPSIVLLRKLAQWENYTGPYIDDSKHNARLVSGVTARIIADICDRVPAGGLSDGTLGLIQTCLEEIQKKVYEAYYVPASRSTADERLVLKALAEIRQNLRGY